MEHRAPHHHAGPLRRILVATDLSNIGERAVARAAHLPLATSAEVEVLHVLADPRLTVAAQLEIEKETARAAAAASPAEQAGVRVAPQVILGSPSDAIVERAAARGDELVVLGRRGRRVLRDLLFGSTVERVVRASPLPVLVVSGEGTRAYRRPLVALDVPPDSCRRSLDLALRILDPSVTRIDVVHALDQSRDGLLLHAGYPAGDVVRERDARKRHARASIHDFLASFDGEAIRWRTSVVVGDPRRVVLEAAARRKSDLIIIGTHERTGLERVLLGSTAEGVLRGATCDVLIARSAGVEALQDASDGPPPAQRAA